MFKQDLVKEFEGIILTEHPKSVIWYKVLKKFRNLESLITKAHKRKQITFLKSIILGYLVFQKKDEKQWGKNEII